MGLEYQEAKNRKTRNQLNPKAKLARSMFPSSLKFSDNPKPTAKRRVTVVSESLLSTIT